MPVIDWEALVPPLGIGLPEGAQIIKWPKTGQTFAKGDTGKPFPTLMYPDCTVFVLGTFTGETCTIQGTPEIVETPTKYATLHDQSDQDLVLSAAASAAVIVEHPTQVRPLMSNAAGSIADAEVYLVAFTQARR